MANKPSRNALCPCNSGKKIKHCCGEAARNFKPVSFGNFTLVAPPKINVSMMVERESDLPQRLVSMARAASERASSADAGEYEAITALLLINTAAEAVLNRLLEPLVDPQEWEGSSKRHGLEWARAEKKWVRLSEKLQMRPNLAGDREPLKSFLATAEARNALVHFKHSRNVEVVETPSVPVKWGGNTVVPVAELATQPPVRTIEEGALHGRLTSAAVSGYFESLRTLLLAVVPACPPELAHVAGALREALGDRQEQAASSVTP